MPSQEVDRNEDMLRSCLRAVDALARVPNALAVPQFKALMDNVVCVGPMAQRYAAIREERVEAEGATPGSDA